MAHCNWLSQNIPVQPGVQVHAWLMHWPLPLQLLKHGMGTVQSAPRQPGAQVQPLGVHVPVGCVHVAGHCCACTVPAAENARTSTSHFTWLNIPAPPRVASSGAATWKAGDIRCMTRQHHMLLLLPGEPADAVPLPVDMAMPPLLLDVAVPQCAMAFAVVLNFTE